MLSWDRPAALGDDDGEAEGAMEDEALSPDETDEPETPVGEPEDDSEPEVVADAIAA